MLRCSGSISVGGVLDWWRPLRAGVSRVRPSGRPRCPPTPPPPEPTRPTEAARLALATLPADVPLGVVFARACELAADALRVARVGVWLFADGRSALRCVNLFDRDAGGHSAGATIRTDDFPAYFAALPRRKSIPAEVAATDPRTAELTVSYLAPLGIGSLLDAGIFVGGELAGVVCHEHVGPPREWTTEDRDFAGSVADLLATRVGTADPVAGGAAHDLRNMLTVVAGRAELLAGRDDLPADARADADALAAAAARGVAVAAELTVAARSAHRSPEVFDPGEGAAGFLPLLRAATGPAHPVRLHREPTGLVLADRTELLRVLLNLVLNARDALPGGGTIDIRVAPGGPAGAPGGVAVEVMDHGVGMDPEVVRRAFDPDFTAKPHGTGLGLAVVRRAVERAGGSVRIDSEPGRGTRVRCYYPAVGGGNGGKPPGA